MCGHIRGDTFYNHEDTMPGHSHEEKTHIVLLCVFVSGW